MTQLIGIDWGTTSVRAYLMDDSRVTDERHARDVGVAALARRPDREDAYATALDALLADWPDAPVIACGMIGSAQGWREVPYREAPCELLDPDALVAVSTAEGRRVHLVRGVSQRSPQPDVMRGEETQLVGLAQAHDGATLIGLPGTHTKWARLDGTRLVRFQTALTGELFGVLVEHSLLGATMAPEADPDAFAPGVRAAMDAHARGEGALLTLFGVRARGLLEGLSPAGQRGFCSGLLIGHEVLDAVAADDDVVLTGSATLCDLYADALALTHGRRPRIVADAAPLGLWALASGAGLL